jgi:hypothetical protein
VRSVDEGLPALRPYNSKVGGQRLLPEGELIFTPESTSANLVEGVTVEAAAGRVQVPNGLQGIVTIQKVEDIPTNVETYSNYVALPVANPDAFFAATR